MIPARKAGHGAAAVRGSRTEVGLPGPAMSLELAELWASTNLREGGARDDIRRCFRRAAAGNAEATLLVAPELTLSERGYFVRWTGRELVVVELSYQQQENFGLGPGVVIRHLEPRVDDPAESAAMLATLGNLRLDQENWLDPDERLSGTCSVRLDPTARIPVEPCAFRARYFHPRMKGRVTTYSYLDYPLMADGDLRFAFPAARSEHNLIHWKSLVVFLQLVRSNGRDIEAGLPCLSNVLTAVVDFKPE